MKITDAKGTPLTEEELQEANGGVEMCIRDSHKLRFADRRSHTHQRFHWKHYSPLRNRINFSRKAESPQIVHEFLIKQVQRSQVIDVFFLKP